MDNFFQLTVIPSGTLQKTFPTGEGGPPQRWMRGGTAFNIVGTTGAEGKHTKKATLALPLGELARRSRD